MAIRFAVNGVKHIKPVVLTGLQSVCGMSSARSVVSVKFNELQQLLVFPAETPDGAQR